MTTPGATEAVTPPTPEELAYALYDAVRHMRPAEARAEIAKQLREAEANALRRCHDLADQKAQACTALADACVIGASGPYSKPDRTILDKRWHTAQAAAFGETAHAIRSLLPKEAGK